MSFKLLKILMQFVSAIDSVIQGEGLYVCIKYAYYNGEYPRILDFHAKPGRFAGLYAYNRYYNFS